MNPVEFPEQSVVLGAPQGVSESQCGGLPAIRLDVGFTSCWEMTEDEWLDIRNNGFKLWLTIYGQGHPVVSMNVEKPFVVNQPEHNGQG